MDARMVTLQKLQSPQSISTLFFYLLLLLDDSYHYAYVIPVDDNINAITDPC